MSVLIKGMEMPKSCDECELCTCYVREDGTEENYRCVITFYPIHEFDKKHEYCPLVEIPPHGRLIDADALRLLYDFSGYKPTGDMTEEEFDRLMYRLPVIRAIIDEAPTIIEAEEGE